MIQKHCPLCSMTTWHNAMAKKPNLEQTYRCTRCGSPRSSRMAGIVDSTHIGATPQMKQASASRPMHQRPY